MSVRDFFIPLHTEINTDILMTGISDHLHNYVESVILKS